MPKKKVGSAPKGNRYPIKHWSYSSLMSFLRNPLAWYTRYVKQIYDIPSGPASVIGRAGHFALEHFYQGVPKEEAIARGLTYLRNVPDFELNFGKAKTKKAQKEKRESMEKDYLQAINFYLARPPRHKVVGAEVRGMAKIAGIPIPLKAISDLVVEAKGASGMLDIVDHKFVDNFNKSKAESLTFRLQALFNYHTITAMYGLPVRNFIVYECKKRKNADGSPQLRKHVIKFAECDEEFKVLHRLLSDATKEITRKRLYLPNPGDMFDGDHSFAIYRMNLAEEDEER